MLNVNLWFARNKDEQIVSILEAHEHEEYTCPVCGSDVIPKALSSRKVTPHYAHIDKSKCDSESMLHWWFKNKFIEKGDTFSIKTDELYAYTCESIEVEKTFHLESGDYRPDVIVHTTDGEEIVFEMANTNKKKVQDYIDRWIELDRVVVEVDIKSLTSGNKTFNALYYKGKCYNFNKRDGGYYNTIGKLKERMIRESKYDVELIKKLDWFWNDLLRYKQNKIEVDELFISFEFVFDNFKDLIIELFKKHNLNNVYKKMINLKSKKIYDMISKKFSDYNTDINYSLEYHDNSNYVCLKNKYFKDDICCWNLLSNIDEIHKKIKNLIFEQSNFINREILSKIANENKILKCVINDLDDKYKKRNSNYHIYDRFCFTNLVSVTYNCDINLEIEINKDIAYSSDYDKIYMFLDKPIKDYLNKLSTFSDLNSLLEISEDIVNTFNNKKILSETNESKIKIKKGFYKTIKETKEYPMTIQYKMIAEDKLQFYIFIPTIEGSNHNYIVITPKHIYNGKYGNANEEIENGKLKPSKNFNKLTLFNDISNEILNFIKNAINSNCEDCGKELKINNSEIEFYLRKNYILPKRCKSCRQKRKRQKEVN